MEAVEVEIVRFILVLSFIYLHDLPYSIKNGILVSIELQRQTK